MKYTDIKSHKDACTYLKRDPELSKILSRYPRAEVGRMKALLELSDIVDAINKITGFKVDWKNINQPKYYPYFEINKS